MTATATATPATAIRDDVTLDQAQALIGLPIPQPADLPSGYRLGRVSTYTYPGLPAWIRQPFTVELDYSDGEGHHVWLRAYPISLGDRASISHLNLEAAPIKEVRDVDVGGRPGVLLRLGSDSGQATWQEVVWEQQDLVLSLSADQLSEGALLNMARSVH